MEAHPPYALFPVINCGVDWLTVTSKRRGVSNALEDFGMAQLAKEKATDGQISVAKRMGYVGLTSSCLFVGNRPTDVMMQVSGPSCTPLAREAIMLSTNVSRIDLQVTIWTEGEACDLAKWTRDVLLARRQGRVNEGGFSLISSYPNGDTLSINRRCSERFGRLYDKTAEASLGPPRLVWRYEVELKGKAARAQAGRLAQCGVHPQYVSKLVHAWYTEKGVQPAFSALSCEREPQPTVEPPTRDVLTWFRESLSKTVAKAIRKHGRGVVLEALGLSVDVDPNRRNIDGVIRSTWDAFPHQL